MARLVTTPEVIDMMRRIHPGVWLMLGVSVLPLADFLTKRILGRTLLPWE